MTVNEKMFQDFIPHLPVEGQELIKELLLRTSDLENECENLKKAKEEAEYSLFKHRSFYDYAPSGYLTLNSEGKILELNYTATLYFKKSKDELKGTNFIRFVDRFYVDDFKSFLALLSESDNKVTANVNLKNPEGIPLPILLEGFSLPNKQEFLVDMVDISGRMKVLEKLVKSEEKYSSFIEDLNEGVAIVDLEETFTYVNKAGNFIFGFSDNELRFKNIRDFITIDQLEIILEETENRKKGISSRYQVNITAADGKEKIIIVSGAPQYNHNGNIVGTLTVFSDITRQKEIEKEIKKRLEIEHLISEISNDFVQLTENNLNTTLNLALEKIGILSDADRSYIFLFSEDGLLFSNTHEWSAPGIQPQIENLQNIPVEIMPWWMGKIRNFETIHIPKVADLPPEAQTEKKLLEEQDIKSTLSIPFLNTESIIGFIGFDAVTKVKEWQKEDILILTIVGEIIGNGLNRLKYEENLVKINAQLELKVEERTREIHDLLEINRVIVENAGLIIMTTDLNGIIKSYNPYAEQILGYKANEIIEKHTPIIFSADEALKNEYLQKLDIERPNGVFKSLKSKIFKEFLLHPGEGIETVFVRKDGLKLNVLLNISSLKNEQLNITTGYILVAIDISERKKMEVELRRSENENKAILNAVPDLLFKIDREGKFIDFHSKPDHSMYVPKQAFLGKKIEQVLPDSLAKQSMIELEQAFLKGQISLYEYQLNVNNSDRYYENRMIKLSENEALSIIRDITDKKLAEDSLKKITQQLHTLIQNMSSGTLFENSERQITLANQSFCNLFGIDLTPEMLVGFDCINALEASKHLMKEPDEFIDRIEKIISSGEVVINDELYLNDGRVFERDYIPITLNEELSGHLWQYRDITQRKLIETNAVIQRDLGFGLATCSTIEQALSKVVNSIIQIKEINAVGIYLLNHESNTIELTVHEGISDEFIRLNRIFKKGEPQFDALQKGEPVYSFHNERIPDSVIQIHDNYWQIGIIPVKYEGKVIGSVNILSTSGKKLNLITRLSIEIIASQIGGTLARIKSENELASSQRNFKTLFDTLDDFIFILDNEGKIMKTNPVVEHQLGYNSDELKGLSVLEVHPPDRREEAGFIVAEMKEGRLDVCPVPLYKKNGDTIPVETKVIKGKWDGNDALYGISRDITERLKAEKILRESEERWHFALEGAGDGVWDLNLLNNEAFYSRQWKSMLGYEADEIENHWEGWQKLVHPDDLPGCNVAFSKHLAEETEFYISEHRLRCKDGTYKWILSRGKLLEYTNEGKPLRIIGTHTDISQRKVFEEHLHKMIEKEKELNDLKSRFVSTASHEFRTPLASILMISDTLISYQKKLDENQISLKLARIKENILHLTNIVNDVLQLSKIQEGKHSINFIETDIIELCKNVIENFNSQLVENRIKFSSKFKSIIAITDNRLVIQSLSNLISNAIKYSKENTDIEVCIIVNNFEIQISVKDFGIGIVTEDQKHIFMPFFRSGNVTSIQGNGLGLSIVKEAMQIHGGNITFVSEYLKGSVFTLHFPKKIIINAELKNSQ